MKKKSIGVISWDKTLELLSPTNQNSEIINALTQASKELKQTKRDYVYYAEFEFGEKLIDKGAIAFSDFEVSNNEFGLKDDQFKSDLSYSKDPLGIIVKNHLEVYSINECYRRTRQINWKSTNHGNGEISEHPYTVPLNILEHGDLFGVFGVLDHITENTYYSDAGTEWYVCAGNNCFFIDFPFFHSNLGSELNEEVTDILRNHASDQGLGKEQIEFVRKYQPNYRTGVVYVPKHYFKLQNKIVEKDIHYQLLLKGWAQYSPLRELVFENKLLMDVMKRSRTFNNEAQFILQLYEYLRKLKHGKSFILKPLKPGKEQHVLLNAVEEFKKEHPKYFRKSGCFQPIVYVYKKEKLSDFSAFSLTNLPILKSYGFKNLAEVIDDLKMLAKEFDKMKRADYHLTNFVGIGPSAYQVEVEDLVQKRESYHKLISSYLGIPFDEFNCATNYTQFSNLILIQSD